MSKVKYSFEVFLILDGNLIEQSAYAFNFERNGKKSNLRHIKQALKRIRYSFVTFVCLREDND